MQQQLFIIYLCIIKVILQVNLTMYSMLDNPKTAHLGCMHHFRPVVST